ncbi:MAG: hypothetical protein R3D34_09060 [Nitratireductor sp.]
MRVENIKRGALTDIALLDGSLQGKLRGAQLRLVGNDERLAASSWL